MEPNAEAIERTLEELADLGPQHSALVAMARSLARAADSEPTRCPVCKGATYNAALWKEYRTTVELLMQIGVGDSLDDDIKRFIDGVSTPLRAPLGDSEEP